MNQVKERKSHMTKSEREREKEREGERGRGRERERKRKTEREREREREMDLEIWARGGTILEYQEQPLWVRVGARMSGSSSKENHI